MKRKLLGLVVCLTAAAALAAKTPDFSGTWEFNTKKGENIGMMTEMKMTATIEQTATSLDVNSHATYQGQDSDTKTHYDLTGKPATNDSPMAGPSETVSKWQGDKLVTTWTSQGAVAGSKVVRTETRWLSPDGKTMTVESVRATRPRVVMAFDKKE